MKKLLITIIFLLSPTLALAQTTDGIVVKLVNGNTGMTTTGGENFTIYPNVGSGSPLLQYKVPNVPFNNKNFIDVVGSFSGVFIMHDQKSDPSSFSCAGISYADCLTSGDGRVTNTGSFTWNNTTHLFSTLVDNERFPPLLSRSGLPTLLSTAVGQASYVAGVTLLLVFTLLGMLIAAGWGWRFIKRHIGQPIHVPHTAMKLQANAKYLNDTDDRSSRGDFLHEGQ